MVHNKNIFLVLFQSESLRSQTTPLLSADTRKCKGICIRAHLRSNPKSILDLVSANWISCFYSRDNNTYFTELIWELHGIKYAKHREHCLLNHRNSANVSFYPFPILSNGISYFILHIKSNTRWREMAGYACSTNCLGKWKLRWVTKMKNTLPNRVQRLRNGLYGESFHWTGKHEIDISHALRGWGPIWPIRCLFHQAYLLSWLQATKDTMQVEGLSTPQPFLLGSFCRQLALT